MAKTLDDYIKKGKSLEPLTVHEPGEVALIIRKIVFGLSKKGDRKMLTVTAAFNEKGFWPVRDYIVFPNDSDSEDNEDIFLRGIADFARAVDEEIWGALKEAEAQLSKAPDQSKAEITEPFEPFLGTETHAIIAEDKYEGRIKNVVSSWVG